MEPRAKKTVKTSLGPVEIRALTLGDLDRLSNSVTDMLARAAASGDGSPAEQLVGLQRGLVSCVREVLSVCSNLDPKKINELGVSDALKLVDAWLEVSCWDDIAHLFFQVKARIMKSLGTKKPS